VIRDEVNVKHIEYAESGDSDVIKLKAKANFKTLGARLGKSMKGVAARVQTLSQDEIRAYQTAGGLALNVDGEDVTLLRGDVEVTAEDVEGWLVSSERGMTVALDTHMTPELEREGMAREFVNRVQNLRKDSGFDVTDRIGIQVSGSDEIIEAIRIHARFIQDETLAESISTDGDAGGDTSAAIDILDRQVYIQLSRLR
jgi:isoleucyl-tRNA synthetase